jgi:hypothetical protein
MNLPESAVRRSVTVYMLIFGLLLLGGISLSLFLQRELLQHPGFVPFLAFFHLPVGSGLSN